MEELLEFKYKYYEMSHILNCGDFLNTNIGIKPTNLSTLRCSDLSSTVFLPVTFYAVGKECLRYIC